MLPDAAALFSQAARCESCPGMGCRPVLSERNGPAPADVMFVGEAPGRFGAGRTGIPFSGDVAGARFERLLAEAGRTRESVFVTNAVLCLPLDREGRNRPPRAAELAACREWLAATIALVDPALIVAMGRVALEALRGLEDHQLQLSDAGGAPVAFNGRQLCVVYHPGARSQVHRPWERQVQDWHALGRAIGARDEARAGVNSLA